VTAGFHCELITDESGQVIARAQVADDLTPELRAALVGAIRAIHQLSAEQDAADPEAAAKRGARQEAAIARVRAWAGLRGGE
jgi:hypothetical protein